MNEDNKSDHWRSLAELVGADITESEPAPRQQGDDPPPPTASERTPVEIIAGCAFELSGKGTGALIVFPGTNDLEDVVQGGISWQGLVTREMISSIFWPDNPVHDGAAIIQDDRITRVCVILPLSRREDLPSRYGTRHRAAAGLAERVLLPGPLDEVEELLAALDLFVLPSLSEGMSNALLEAIAAKVPVVTTSTSFAACCVPLA